LFAGDVKAMITLSPALKFNGGGHINHSIFWQNMCPGGSEPPKELVDQVTKDFGSFDKMKATLTATTVGIQGSGWGWLGYNKQMGRMQIIACPNQDPLEATTGM
jgi:Fe-Mn family superoxide dismutase